VTPDAVKDALHALEIRVVREVAVLNGKLDGALSLAKTVHDVDDRVRELEAARRLSWRDIGALAASLAAAVAIGRGLPLD
jgi:hypothetical protein